MALKPSAAALTAVDESALSQDEVAAALQALKQHLESGKPLGKNENGEDFVEIQEVWKDGIQLPPLEEEEGAGIEEEAAEEELSSGFITDDDNHFDSLMEEIEALELDDEAVNKSLPRSTSTGRTQQQVTTAGLKRGFLLDSTTSKPGTSRAAADIAKAAAPLPKAAASANRDSRDAPFIGDVVERQPGSSTRPPSHLSGSSESSSGQKSGENLESDASVVEQPRISRFKQQRYGGY